MPRWIVVAWNILVAGVTALVVLSLVSAAFLINIMSNVAIVMRGSVKQATFFMAMICLTDAFAAVGYGLHLSTFYNRFTRWKLALAVIVALATVMGVVFPIALAERMRDPSGLIVRWAWVAGPMLVLSALVVIARRSIWVIGAGLLLRLAFGRAAANAAMRADADGGDEGE